LIVQPFRFTKKIELETTVMENIFVKGRTLQFSFFADDVLRWGCFFDALESIFGLPILWGN